MRLLKPAWVSHGYVSKDNGIGRPIYSLDIHPDGSRLATSGVIDTCGVVILWNMVPIRNPDHDSDPAIPRKLFQMDNHQACVNCVRWSPTGHWLASAGMDKVVMLWVKTGAASRPTTVFGSKEQTKFTENWRCANVLRGHLGDIIDLAWSCDEQRLASASVDNTIIIWSKQKGQTVSNVFVLLSTLRSHTGFVKGVVWDPVGRYLASQSDDLSVKIWRTADWQEECNITKPFAKAVGQSQVMRLSWSLDGSTIASPHAVNNGFPTAKLIDRTNWMPNLDLVGHRKHVICARYNPNVLRKENESENIGSVCLALGSKDRSVSVWSTGGRRARVVIHDLFTNSVCDLSWSSNGMELMACSLDGSVAYFGFTHKELGTPWSIKEVIRLHRKVYGQSSLDKFVSISTDEHCKQNMSSLKPSSTLNQSDILLETPEALVLQKSQADLCQRLNVLTKNIEPNSEQLKTLPKGPAKQIESRSKDGRRRITPKFLGHLDGPDEDTNSNPQFTASQHGLMGKSETRSNECLSEPTVSVSSKKPNTDLEDAKLATESVSENQMVLSDNVCDTKLEASNVITASNSEEIRRPIESSKTFSNTLSSSESTPATSKSVTVSFMETNSSPLKSDSLSHLKRTPCEPVDLDNVGQTDVPKAIQEDLTKGPSLSRQRKRRCVRLFTGEDKQARSITDNSKQLTQPRKPDSPPPKVKPQSDGGEFTNECTSTASANVLIGRIKHLIDIPEQLANVPKVQFVCSQIDGPIIVQISNLSTRIDDPIQCLSSNSRIIATRGDRRLWELNVRDRLTAYAHTNNVIAVGDCKGHLQLLYSLGGKLCPNLLIDSIHTLAIYSDADQSTPLASSNSCSDSQINFDRLHAVVNGNDPTKSDWQNDHQSVHNYRLAALCQSGRLLIWDVAIPSSVLGSFSRTFNSYIYPKLVAETNIQDVLFGHPGAKFSSINFGLLNNPVVYLQDGSSFIFDVQNRIWLELFDASDPIRCQIATAAIRGCPPGPLSCCQLLSKVSHNISKSTEFLANAMSGQNSSNAQANQRITIQNFLEFQTQTALTYGSSNEYHYWLLRWFRQLVEDNEEERIRQICQDLIGPISSNSKSHWESEVKGLRKRDLVKELLSLFALNLRLQRLYVELKEILDYDQTTGF